MGSAIGWDCMILYGEWGGGKKGNSHTDGDVDVDVIISARARQLKTR